MGMIKYNCGHGKAGSCKVGHWTGLCYLGNGVCYLGMGGGEDLYLCQGTLHCSFGCLSELFS